MRFIAGSFGVIVALALLGYEFVQFYQIGTTALGSDQTISLYNWTISLGGAAAVATVAYEALAWFLAKNLREAGHKDEGRILMAMLAVAMLVTARYEWRGQAGGQAHKTVAASDAVEAKTGLKSDLQAARDARNAWQAKVERTSSWKEELDRLNRRVDDLQKQVESKAGATDPEADVEQVAAATGTSKEAWTLGFTLLILTWWSLVRAFAFSLAMRCVQITFKREKKPAKDWSKAESYMNVPAVIEAEAKPSNVTPFEAPKDTRSLEEIVREVVQSMPAGKVSLEDIWARVNDELLNANRSPVRDGVVTGILTTLKVERSPTRDSKSTFYTIKKASGRGRKEPALSLAKAA